MTDWAETAKKPTKIYVVTFHNGRQKKSVSYLVNSIITQYFLLQVVRIKLVAHTQMNTKWNCQTSQIHIGNKKVSSICTTAQTTRKEYTQRRQLNAVIFLHDNN